jgi:hypothetical protein
MKTRSFNLVIILALLLSLLGSALTVTPARATSFTAGTAAELISAINNANAIVDTDLDTITLTADISLTDVDNTTISGPNGLPVILASGGNLTIEGDGFTLSRAGGSPDFRFFENEGNLTLNNITLLNGSAPSSGGGIFNTGTLTVTNSTFTNNSTSGTTSGGGAIYSQGTLNVSSSTFDGNTASATGAGSGGLGGAISVGNGQLTVSNSTFHANRAYGGNCGTTCTESGTGGVDIRGGSGHSIVNSTFSDNTFTPGTNGSITGYTVGALFTTVALNLSNTILANSGGTDCSDFNNTVSGSNNLIESDGSLPFACGGVAVTSDPQLGSLTNNGGPTQTMALPTGSPAMDAGDATACSNAPVSGLDQRGVTRPLGAGCDIGAFELDTFTSTFTSQAVQDGRLLESSETSDASGWLDSTAPTFIVGDDDLDRQYRSILHFDTSSLPDNAIITKAVLAIKRQGITGSDPFLSLGLLQVDMRKPDFGAPSLELLDFNAAPAKTNVGSFSSSLSTPWHRAILNNAAERYVNLLGTTQFRLSFTLDDDDNNTADFIRFYSGDSHTGSSPAASRPKLTITYTLP